MIAALYGFAYTEKALASLRELQPRYRRQIDKKIKALALEPHPKGSKLILGREEGGDPVYRIRSGDYRTLYVVRDSMIVVLDIDHRKDVYR